MDYILEFSSPEIKCCKDCRFYVCGYCDDYGCEYDRYCTAAESPLTDDPDLRMDWCPLGTEEDETAEWIDKEVRGTMTNACSKCGGTGADGYPEYSEEWKKCGTVCEYCAGEGYSDRVRGHRIEDSLTDLPLVLPGEVLTTSEMEAVIGKREEDEEQNETNT